MGGFPQPCVDSLNRLKEGVFMSAALTPEQIQAALPGLAGWQLEGSKLLKAYRFKDFKAALAFINQAGAIAEQQGGAPIGEALRNGNPAMKDRALPGTTDYTQIPELAERGRARTARFFDLLEDRLQASPWLAGEAF